VGWISPNWFAYILPVWHMVDQRVFYVRVVSTNQFIVTNVEWVSLCEDSVFRCYLFRNHLLWEVLRCPVCLPVFQESSMLIYSRCERSVVANYLSSSGTVVKLSRLFEIAVLILSVWNPLLEYLACISIKNSSFCAPWILGSSLVAKSIKFTVFHKLLSSSCEEWLGTSCSLAVSSQVVLTCVLEWISNSISDQGSESLS
jgi:hypothetical protein